MDVLSLSSPIPSLKAKPFQWHKPSSAHSLNPTSQIPTSRQRTRRLALSPKCSYSQFPLLITSNESLLLASAAAVVNQSPGGGGRGGEGDPMAMLLKERIVFIGDEIDDFFADAIISQLLLLDAQDSSKDIKLFINSPGGSLSATMAIFDVVQLVRSDVSTVALGISASTASVILAGGTKGKRFAMPNTRIMIHQPLGGASGQAIDVEIQAREVMLGKQIVTTIFANCTGRTYEQIEKDIDRDRYMSPMEAVEYGIIDGVIDRDSIIPLVPIPERVKPTLGYEEMRKDMRKFLTPDIPDDEIY